ncbi:TonB-dependent receptor [Algibacillus agarilyticus]|uniref:TonB-dependent receptor n=1 Tax=Algibacillus agarilyticus TaxID=2234133 RepID=UPI0013008946|nr:TonB-dependent receptor [Algibacillus agarilyticus]
MKKNTAFFKPSLLSLSVASILSMSATHAIAAGEAAEEMETIEVTGIRGSMIKSMDVKRESSGVVDAISSEDMGKFPDTNLAESLQRVSGVSIDRKNGEGNQITVRGFGPSFNLVTLNGRSMPFADSPKQEGAGGTQNRSFNFEQIASESVSGVNIYKTARASQATGGIGATVDIQTAKPLDYDGFKAAFGIKGMMDTSNEQGRDITPEISGMISNVFLAGKLGVLAAFSSSQRDSAQEIIATDGWLLQKGGACQLGYNTTFSPDCGGASGTANVDAIDPNINPKGNIWLPQNYNMDVSHHERDRTNGQIVVQFAPTKDIKFGLDYFFSDYTDTVERYQTAHWIGNWVTATADKNGTLAKIVNGGGGTDFIGYYDEIETVNDSVGFNVDWQINDTLAMKFDIHSSTSHAQPEGNLSEQSILLTNADFNCSTYEQCYAGQFTLDYNDDSDLPLLNSADSFADANFNGYMHYLYDYADTGDSPYDLDYLGGNLVIGRGNEVENTIDQAKLDFTWVNDADSPLARVKFGTSIVDFQYDTTWRMNMTTLGRAWNPTADQVNLVPRGDVGNDFSGSETLFTHFLEFDVGTMYRELEKDYGFTFNPEVYNSINEKTTSVYVQSEFESDIDNMPLNITAGARYESTDVSGSTRQVTPYALRFESLTELRAQYADTPEFGTTQLNGEYSYFLPSIDLSLEVQDDLITRVSIGRSLTRNDLTALRPAATIATSRPSGPYLAYQGNSNLKPYLSTNFDVSLEWYYDEGSYASIGYFKKWVDNYISNETTTGKLYNADNVAYTDPSQGDVGGPGQCPTNGSDVAICDGSVVTGAPEIDWTITTPVNKESASVNGIEVALQHLFADTGFGLQTNFTIVDGDVEFDVSSVEEQTSLTGLSDSANFVAFYDQNGFQVRVAYNWRDEFLAYVGQLRSPGEPVYTETYGQFDANASYDINDNFTVFVEALNLTDETLRQHGRFDNQLVSAQAFGARFNVGLRGKF